MTDKEQQQHRAEVEPRKPAATAVAERRPESHDPAEPKSTNAVPTLGIIIGVIAVIIVGIIVVAMMQIG